MDWHGRSIRMGAAVIAVAVLLRLYGTGTFGAVVEAITSPAVESFVLYLETGRVVRPDPEPETAEPTESARPETTETQALPVFSATEAEAIYVWGSNPDAVDAAALLEMPLELDLTGDGPTVLIFSTHTTESYTQAGNEYAEASPYRTTDTSYNMAAIGARVEELLEAAGIGVVRSGELHDYPNYTGAYDRSRATVEELLSQYPSIRLVLDLHRDSVSSDGGLDTSAQKDGQESAQLMLLMSTGCAGWQENLNLAVKLTAQLEQMYPGITRGILTRNSAYNQDLGPLSMLVEVGGDGNTQAEALTAAEALAEAIIALAHGTQGQ